MCVCVHSFPSTPNEQRCNAVKPPFCKMPFIGTHKALRPPAPPPVRMMFSGCMSIDKPVICLASARNANKASEDGICGHWRDCIRSCYCREEIQRFLLTYVVLTSKLRCDYISVIVSASHQFMFPTEKPRLGGLLEAITQRLAL